MISISTAFEPLKSKFIEDFIVDDKWRYLARGLGNTLVITLFAVLMGIALGFFIAVIRTTYDRRGITKSAKQKTLKQKLLSLLLNILNGVCKVYLTVIRGTPVVVQLLIIYFVIFASVNVDKVFVAVLAFGINSGAYVAEIIRSGIMSIEQGQMEAGRSLGLNYFQTMYHIIFPQAFKNVLPALANEFIVLLKETSISGYIAMQDLTKGGDIIRSITYDPLLPLITVAIIYLVIVMILTAFVSKLERRLRASDH